MTTTQPISTQPDFEAEFDRVVSAFLANQSVGGWRSASSGADADLRVEAIYVQALEIIDVHGLTALTFRKLAGDLKMSTRTLRKRVGNRDNLIRGAVAHYASGLRVTSVRGKLWERAVLDWCHDLRSQLLARPNITQLMDDSDGRLLDQQLVDIVDHAVRDGIPFDLAHRCCQSLARMTMNDAVIRCRGRSSAGELLKPAAAPVGLFDTIGWVIAGIRAESNSGNVIRKGAVV